MLVEICGLLFLAVWLFNARQMGKFRKWGWKPMENSPKNTRKVVTVIGCGIVLLALLGAALQRIF